MKKILFELLLHHTLICLSFGQFSPDEINRKKDSLVAAIPDTTKAIIFSKLSNDYQYSNIDSCLHYARQALTFSRKINFVRGEGMGLFRTGAALRQLGNIPEALRNEFAALAIAKKISDHEVEGGALNVIGNIFGELGDDRKALEHYLQSKKAYEQVQLEPSIIKVLSNISGSYLAIGKLDSAFYFQNEAYKRKLKSGNRREVAWTAVLLFLGEIHSRLGNDSLALQYFRKGVMESVIDADIRNRAAVYLSLATFFRKISRPDSSIKYADSAFISASSLSFQRIMLRAANLLTELYKTNHVIDSTIKYLEISKQIADSLFGLRKYQQLQNIILNEQQLHQKLREEKDKLQSNYKLGVSITAVVIVLFISLLLWKRNLRQKKVNRQLNEQKQQIASQNTNLEKTLENLRFTQAQLIQSEKMASLGELTAGIAHEIQNPLNFVNNFSEVNKELVDELQEELKAGKVDVAISISNDIKENEQKINHHGKRADAIVKGMLQHSRTNSGQKAPTDINALTDEYVRLAYHGQRAKDKSLSAGLAGFNATVKTDFDPSVEKIYVVPQDIGRVILNLINNAFYAVGEKMKQQSIGYEPGVSLTTKKVNGKVEISVKDIGNGIPQEILDKIFQPFFTTKPTGQGTGLGLSLAYDIVKAHGGEIKVETKEGEGSEFIIGLPLI